MTKILRFSPFFRSYGIPALARVSYKSDNVKTIHSMLFRLSHSNRFFSTQQPSGQTGTQAADKLPSPPDNSLASRTAYALIKVAHEKGKMVPIYDDLQTLEELLEKNENFTFCLTAPTISTTEKLQVLKQVASRCKMDSVTVNFLSMLAENRRMSQIRQILDVYFDLHLQHHGKLKIHVTSARALKPSEEKEVQAALQKRLGSSLQLVLDFNVSPSILGGLVIRWGHDILDFTVVSRMDRIQSQLHAPLT